MIYQIEGANNKFIYINLKLVKSIQFDTNSFSIEGVSYTRNNYPVDDEDLITNWIATTEEPVISNINKWPSEKLELKWKDNDKKDEVSELVSVSASILNGFSQEQKNNTDYAVFLGDEVIRKSKNKKGV